MSRFDPFKRIPKPATIAIFVVAFVLGLLFGGGDGKAPAGAAHAGHGSKAQWYTCSMHPQVRLPDPDARCPICGMELIPVTDDSGGGDDDSPRTLRMSEAARRLAEIETAPVERRFVTKEVQLVGKLDYDETLMRTITAWVPGRLDRLYVDYTGVAVRKGAPMVWLYSPELLVTQESLLEADRALAKMKRSEASEANVARSASTVKAMEDRLRLWGLTKEQITEIRERGTASDHMTILSPIAGIVTRKLAVEGDYVGVGTKIYHIADLSSVWLYLDAYESDLAWIRYAQEVHFDVEAYPGEVFRGRISFIDPFLDEKTRTVRVRVTVENVDGRLKPGMFARARIRARLAAGGRLVEPFLAGKWISPVHPEIVSDRPGDCPICGTPLVSADSLGYVGEDAEPPLVIPASAPLRTGKRAVVYVRVPDAERPTYEGRVVLLGPRTKEHYLVAGGVQEGEQVVVKGNFKIDSALQILARPSMMSPPEEQPAPERAATAGAGTQVNAEFREALTPFFDSMLALHAALAGDDLAAARTAAAAAGRALDGIEAVPGDAWLSDIWTELRTRATAEAEKAAAAADLAAARAAYDSLGSAAIALAHRFGHARPAPLRVAYCPMALDNRGASWLQEGEAIRNPFFGTKMPGCGEIRETIAPAARAVVPEAFREGLAAFADGYLAIAAALAADDLDGAREAAVTLAGRLGEVPAAGLAGEPLEAWRAEAGRLHEALDVISKATGLEEARRPFALLSDGLDRALRRFGYAGKTGLVRVHCPMAFSNRGAEWIQRGEEVRNPYFGAAMPRCGDVSHRYAAEPGK